MTSVGVVTDLGGAWHLVKVTTPGPSSLLNKLSGLAPTPP